MAETSRFQTMLAFAMPLLFALPAMGQASPASQPEGKPLWIAVAASGLVKTIEPLARRRAGEGFEIQILDDTKLRTDRQRADRDVAPIRKIIRDAIARRPVMPAGPAPVGAAAPLVCVVLVGFEPGITAGGTGDLPAGEQPQAGTGQDRDQDRGRGRPGSPASGSRPGSQPGPQTDPFALPGGAGTADNMAGRPSDAVIGDLTGDGRLAVSLGRLPARSAAELEQMIDKIVRFESQTVPAEWHHRFLLLGGSPTYRVIERLVGAGVDRLDGRWLGTVFYDQPNSQFSLPPDKLPIAALAAMERGSAVTVYIGHSGVNGFFLDRGMLDKVRIPTGAGPLISLSCLGGVQSSASGDGFAVAAMRNKDGPVATFGAAQVSYPQWNKLLAEGLEKNFFNARPASSGSRAGEHSPMERDGRLADVIDGMRRNLAVGRLDLITLVALNLADGSNQDYPAQRKGQLQMYSLFGDPATRLPWRLTGLTLTGPERAAAGQAVRLAGWLADRTLDGATVQVLIRRQALPIPPGPPGESDQARHQRVNRLVLVTAQAVVAGDRFEVELRLPASVESKAVIARAWAVSKAGRQAIGSCRIELSEK